MYFKQIDEILSGAKTQTRRVCKSGEYFTYTRQDQHDTFEGKCFGDSPLLGPFTITAVYAHNRLKWQVGRDYAVSPGRGLPVVMWRGEFVLQYTREHTVTAAEWKQAHIDGGWQPLRIRITEIRRQPLQDISEADAIAEGYPHTVPQLGVTILPPVSWYAELWTAINGKGSWRANPDVWVLTFEVVRNG